MAGDNKQDTESTPGLQPKLRMIRNGSTEVNVVRAELCAGLVVPPAIRGQYRRVRTDHDAPVKKTDLAGGAAKGKLAEPPEVKACVFVQLISSRAELPLDKEKVSGRLGRLAVATVPISELAELANQPQVAHVELGEPLKAPTPVLHPGQVEAPFPRWKLAGSATRHRKGEGVLIGVIDVGGFDFAHSDFLDRDGKTRFVSIWDQGGRFRSAPSGEGSGRFVYGSELTRPMLNAAIRGARKARCPPQELEPQSEMHDCSHGTHVASIVAGNRGLCPNAHLAGVLINIPSGESDGRRSFYDSSRIVHAVEYLLRLADDLGGLPVSINISLGTNGHAHDATSPASRWLDSVLNVPGRCICVAAGNAGQEVAQFEGDQGYILGRVHTSGRVPSRGLTTEFHWVVIGDGIADISENELELWYGPQDRFAISIRPPGGPWIGPVRPCEYVENRQLADGSCVSIYNELYYPANGANYIAVYLSPFMSDDGAVGVPAGTWTVRLEGVEVRDGRYHAWIERDDPRPMGRSVDRALWRYPSFFAEGSFVDRATVSSLACGNHIISVANLDEAANRVNITSSQGPTRDDRLKPEVAAPGTGIVAARGFSGEGGGWVAMSGTSMASPFVAGVAGLMLAAEPSLTAAQISGMIQRTARPLPGSDYAWLHDAGFGVIAPSACIAETALANRRTDVSKRK